MSDSAQQRAEDGLDPHQQQQQQPIRHLTPPAPPFSPITPEIGHAVLAGRQPDHIPPIPQHPTTPQPNNSSHQPRMVQEPPAPLPLDLSENTDAIALRSAISILMMQKQRAAADIKTLQAQKEMAVKDVRGFTNALGEGKVRGRREAGVMLPQEDDDDDEEAQESAEGKESFGKMNIPVPQNVVRMPPVNWAQYHVVGESLDILHRLEQRRPTGGVPEGGDEVVLPKQTRDGAAVVAAPYDEWLDGNPGRDRMEMGRGSDVMSIDPTNETSNTSSVKASESSGRSRRKSSGAGSGRKGR